MNGRLPPMLGGPGPERERQNARVKKSPTDPRLAGCAPRSPTRILAPSRSKASVHPVSGRSRAAGFTLIEVLIALIVLVLGVLGAAGMTLASMRDSKQSGLRSQASAFAYEIADIMRANPGQEAVFTGSTLAATSSCWTSGCAPADMAKNDYNDWLNRVQGTNGLPNGNAVICHDSALSQTLTCDNVATAPLVVKLKWDEKNNNARGQSSGGTVTPAYLLVVVSPYGT
jgi:type IV pilus assembly protein PilV